MFANKNLIVVYKMLVFKEKMLVFKGGKILKRLANLVLSFVEQLFYFNRLHPLCLDGH